MNSKDFEAKIAELEKRIEALEAEIQPNSSTKFDHDSLEWRISNNIWQALENRDNLFPKLRKYSYDKREAELQKWADEVRKIIEYDIGDTDDSKRFFKWLILIDDFWLTHGCMTVMSFRKARGDEPRKIDHMISKWRKAEEGTSMGINLPKHGEIVSEKQMEKVISKYPEHRQYFFLRTDGNYIYEDQ